jgi:gliding motility-associated-like protein
MLNDSTSNQPETVILTTDTTFTLTITDLISGCKGTDSVHVKVIPQQTHDDCIVFHNVITPNGDGLNDSWIIDCIEEYPNNTVKVFNRWGNLVYSFENYNNTSIVWKGTNQKGDQLPDGTYYYLLTIKNGNKYSGWIFLRSGSE